MRFWILLRQQSYRLMTAKKPSMLGTEESGKLTFGGIRERSGMFVGFIGGF